MTFSKNKARALVLFIVLNLLVGCGLGIGEKKSDKKSFKIESCFKSVRGLTQKYFNGQMTENQASQYFACFEKGIRDFKDYMKLKSMTEVPPTELTTFLHKSFGAPEIGRPLVESLMIFKENLIHTSKEKIQVSDLEKLIELFDLLSPSLAKLAPFMLQVRFQKNQLSPHANISKVLQGSLVLKELFRNINVFVQKYKSSLELDSFRIMIEQLLFYFKWTERKVKKLQLPDWFHFIKETKQVIFPTEKSLIRGASEWKGVVLIFNHWFVSGQMIRYGLKELKFLQHEIDLSLFHNTLKGVLDSLDQTLRLISKKSVSVKSFSHILSELSKTQAIPVFLNASRLEKAITPLIRRGISQNGSLNDKINLHKVSVLKSRLKYWFQNLRQLYSSGKMSHKGESEALKLYSKKGIIYDRLTGRLEIEGWSSEKGIGQRGAKDQRYRLSKAFSLRLLVEFIADSFSEKNPKGADKKITQQEFTRFLNAIRPLLLDLKLLDPQVKNLDKNLFFEANHFSLSGKGLGPIGSEPVLGLDEGVWFLSLLMTSQNVTSKIFLKQEKNKITKEKKINPNIASYALKSTRDFSGLEVVEEKPFLDVFFQLLLKETQHVPRLQQYIKGLDSEKKSEMLELLKILSHVPCDTEEFVSKAQLMKMVTSLHYIETLFSVYDREEGTPGVISGKEAERAYLRFSGVMKRVIQEKLSVLQNEMREFYKKAKSYIPNFVKNVARFYRDLFSSDEEKEKRKKREENDIKAWLLANEKLSTGVFYHLLEFGEVPQGMTLLDYALFQKETDSIEMDRLGLLRVLSVFVTLSRKESVDLNKGFICH